jgi:hypothetical protein
MANLLADYDNISPYSEVYFKPNRRGETLRAALAD